MMIGDEINEDTGMFSVAGGNFEIIHLCEQKGLQFDDCLYISSFYHRFEIYEWLNTHFNYDEPYFIECIACYNEPLFYYYYLSGSNSESNEIYEKYLINTVSKNGNLEILKYLNETCHVKICDSVINIASENGHLDIVKYLCETCHTMLKSKTMPDVLQYIMLHIMVILTLLNIYLKYIMQMWK